METSAIMENRIWRLPQGLRHAPVRWRCPPMRFFGRVQVLAGAVTLWALVFAEAGWAWWALALFGCFLYGCVGLPVGFHRYFACRSFGAQRWAVVMFHVLQTTACIGMAVGWSTTHRRHHRHANRAGDLYPAKAVGWRELLVESDEGRGNGTAVRWELRRDRFGAQLYQRCLLRAPDSRLAVFFRAIPVALALLGGGLVTMACQRWGSRLHKTGDENRNDLFVALLTWGEGWHNDCRTEPGKAVFHSWLDVEGVFLRLAGKGADFLIIVLRYCPEEQARNTGLLLADMHELCRV